MKSLEERIAFREEQKAEAQEKAQQTGDAQPASEGEFSATEWLNDTIPNIEAAIGDLSNEELDAIEAAESGDGGKGRAGVKSAIAAERTKRTNAGGNWNSQQA